MQKTKPWKKKMAWRTNFFLSLSLRAPGEMVSKTMKQRQKKLLKMKQNGGTMPPPPVPQAKKPVDQKKSRPNWKGKMKIRYGMTSSDVYEGFEDLSGVQWRCPQCGKLCRVVGFCADCASGVASPHSVSATLANKRKAARKAASKSSLLAGKEKKQRGSLAAAAAAAVDAKERTGKMKFKAVSKKKK